MPRSLHLHRHGADAHRAVPRVLRLGDSLGGASVVVGGRSEGEAPREQTRPVSGPVLLRDDGLIDPCHHRGVPAATSQRWEGAHPKSFVKINQPIPRKRQLHPKNVISRFGALLLKAPLD